MNAEIFKTRLNTDTLSFHKPDPNSKVQHQDETLSFSMKTEDQDFENKLLSSPFCLTHTAGNF